MDQDILGSVRRAAAYLAGDDTGYTRRVLQFGRISGFLAGGVILRFTESARRKVRVWGAASLVIALCAMPNTAFAATNSGTDSRPMPTQIFHETSPFYQKLPDDTPVAPDSAELSAAFKRQTIQYYGTPETPNLDVNFSNFAPALYVSRNSDPAYDIVMWNCQGKTDPNWADEISEQLKGIHIPADMIPDQSADGSVSIFNEDDGTVTDLWQVRKNGDQWEACWGGKILNAAESIGAFEPGYGASASGLAQSAYVIRHQELVNGKINHVINVGLPEIKAWPAWSWPANRTDGGHTGTALTIGQILRLPADLDIDSLNLSPAARTIAIAAQEYGIMVTETSGSVSIGAENYIGLKDDRYDEVFRGRWASQEMLGDPARGEQAFPIDQLEVLPIDYRAPLNNPGPKGPPPTNPADVTEAPSTDGEDRISPIAITGGVVAVVLLAGGVAYIIVRNRRRGA